MLLEFQLATGTFDGEELAEDDEPGWRNSGIVSNFEIVHHGPVIELVRLVDWFK